MINVIYWSGAGNTEAMAQAVLKGIEAAGQEGALKTVSEITAEEAASFDKLALGCADMGVEQLEESEFEPFFAALEGKLAGKKVVVFGSYGWGGTLFDEWAERVSAAGATVVAAPVSYMGYPDDACVADCEALGKALAEA